MFLDNTGAELPGVLWVGFVFTLSIGPTSTKFVSFITFKKRVILRFAWEIFDTL